MSLTGECKTPSREKFWKELDSKKKIERMREVLKSV